MRRALAFLGPLALLYGVIIYGSALAGVGGIIGMGVMAWVLWRAAPGCWRDLRALFSASSSLVSGLDARRSPNNGF